MAWTWLAILAGAASPSGAAVARAVEASRRRRADRPGRSAVADCSPAVAARSRRRWSAAPSPRSRTWRRSQPGHASAARWVDRVLDAMRAGRRRRQLVELLDAAMVCTARRGSAPGPRHRRRPDAPRPGLGRSHRRDRSLPRDAPGLRHPPDPTEVAELAAALRPRADRRPGRPRADARRRGVEPGRDGRPAPAAAPARRPPRVPRLSYFFPAHNEEANLEGLVEEALATLPALAETFEIIIVDDGSRDATPAIADELAARAPRTSSGPSTTRSTSATARRCGPASRPPATSSSPSPTATASSGSPTSAG